MTAIYRTTRKLSVGVGAGEAFLETRLNPTARKILAARGIIHELPMPPLSILAAFEHEHQWLATRGIITLGDLLSSTALEFEHLRVIGWQILNPSSDGCINCKRR